MLAANVGFVWHASLGAKAATAGGSMQQPGFRLRRRALARVLLRVCGPRNRLSRPRRAGAGDERVVPCPLAHTKNWPAARLHLLCSLAPPRSPIPFPQSSHHPTRHPRLRASGVIPARCAPEDGVSAGGPTGGVAARPSGQRRRPHGAPDPGESVIGRRAAAAAFGLACSPHSPPPHTERAGRGGGGGGGGGGRAMGG